MADGIEVRGLRKRFGPKTVLEDVSFSVPPGQICGYLGANGAGKTTTFELLTGALRPDEGSIHVAGHPVAGDAIPAKRAIGYVPEKPSLYSLLSIREHLALISDLHGLDPREAGKRGEALLEEMAIRDVANRPVASLSKGQKQKGLIVCALLSDPQVLLFDEPLGGLDVMASKKLRDRLRALADEGRTVFYSSHVLDVVERLCDRTIVLHGGTIVADAPTAELAAKAKKGTLEDAFHALVGAADAD